MSTALSSTAGAKELDEVVFVAPQVAATAHAQPRGVRAEEVFCIERDEAGIACRVVGHAGDDAEAETEARRS